MNRRIEVELVTGSSAVVTLGDLHSGELFHEVEGQYSSHVYLVLDSKKIVRQFGALKVATYLVANLRAGTTRIIEKSTRIIPLRQRNTPMELLEIPPREFFAE